MSNILGIIDRGVGGLGLYKKLRQTSSRPILYFADNASQPYGLVEKAVLKKRLEHIIDVLKSRGAKHIVFACNSASVVYPDTNHIKGIIPFGVSSLLKANSKNPALIATNGTVDSAAYKTQFKQHGISVIEHKAQAFAIHIENGVIDGEQLECDAKEIMLPLAQNDAVLMACTHFPAIKTLLQRHLQAGCKLIDPVDEMAQWIEQNWINDSSSKDANTQFLTSGSTSSFIKSAKLSFNVDIDPKAVSSVNNLFYLKDNK